MVKIIHLGNLYNVILKMQRRVNIKKISKFNNNANNSYEIKLETYKMKDLIALS